MDEMGPRQHTEVKLAGNPSLRHVECGRRFTSGTAPDTERNGGNREGSTAHYRTAGAPKHRYARVFDHRRGARLALRWAGPYRPLVRQGRSGRSGAPPPGGGGP